MQGFNYSPYGYADQSTQATNNIIVVFVQGEAGARAYPVAAGNTVLLMDFEGKHFWLKSTDMTGMPQQLRYFTFSETSMTPQIPTDYVKREELQEISQKLEKLLTDLGGTQ